MKLEEVVKRLTPHASPLGRACFAGCDAVMARWQIDNRLRQEHALAQFLAETGGLSRADLTEDLNYTTAGRLAVVFRRYFPTEADAAPYVRNPEALANHVYADANRDARHKLGNVRDGDGWAYRGRGLVQITGRAMYARVGRLVGVDLESRPDMACNPGVALSVACAVWSVVKGCNPLADADNLVSITSRINGGLTGLDTRRTWLTKVRRALAA